MTRFLLLAATIFENSSNQDEVDMLHFSYKVYNLA